MIVGLTVKIFGILLIGYLAKKKELLSDGAKDSLSELLTNVVLPCSMLASSQQGFSPEQGNGLLLVFILAAGYYAVTLLVGQVLLAKCRINKERKIMSLLLVVFSNVGFIGFSIMGEALGDTGTLYTIAYNCAFQLFFFSYAMLLLQGKQKISIRNLTGNRIIWISVLAILLYLFPFRFPGEITAVFQSAGSIMMPLSMLIIGAELADLSWKKILCDKLAWLLSAIRVLVLPGLMLLLLTVMGLDQEMTAAVVILTCLPSGSLNVIMARKYQMEPEFAAIVVAQTMLLMIVVLPFFMKTLLP